MYNSILRFPFPSFLFLDRYRFLESSFFVESVFFFLDRFFFLFFSLSVACFLSFFTFLFSFINFTLWPLFSCLKCTLCLSNKNRSMCDIYKMAELMTYFENYDFYDHQFIQASFCKMRSNTCLDYYK